MKKIFLTYFTIFMSFIMTESLVFANSPTNCKIYVDDKEVVFSDAQPFIDENDRILVPVRAIAEATESGVLWDESRQRVTVTGKVNCTVIDIGSNIMFLNGKKIEMDTTAKIVNDRTYAPLRYLGEGLNYSVENSDDMSAVYLTKKEDDPVFANGSLEYLKRMSGDLSPYWCDTEFYTYEDIPTDISDCFKNKTESEIYTAKSYDEFFSDSYAIPSYSVNNTIYKEKVVLSDALTIISHVLCDMSDDILVEFIPDDDNSDGEIILDLYKNYYTKTAEESYIKIAVTDIPKNERSVTKISEIYNDNLIAPFWGTENENGFWISLSKKDGNICSGILRITSVK